MRNLAQKSRKIITNESGQATLLLSLAFAAISAILVIQMSSANQFVNTLHSKRKAYLAQQEIVRELALQVKQAYDKGELRRSINEKDARKQLSPCAGNERKIDIGKKADASSSSYLCMPNRGFCVTEKNAAGRPTKYCLSQTASSFALPARPAASGNSSEKKVKNQFTGKVSRVSVRIPQGANSPALRCESVGNPCVRINLCPPDEENCSERTALVSQVLRLGALNNKKLQDVITQKREVAESGYEKANQPQKVAKKKERPSVRKKKKRDSERNYRRRDYDGPRSTRSRREGR